MVESSSPEGRGNSGRLLQSCVAAAQRLKCWPGQQWGSPVQAGAAVVVVMMPIRSIVSHTHCCYARLSHPAKNDNEPNNTSFSSNTIDLKTIGLVNPWESISKPKTKRCLKERKGAAEAAAAADDKLVFFATSPFGALKRGQSSQLSSIDRVLLLSAPALLLGNSLPSSPGGLLKRFVAHSM